MALSHFKAAYFKAAQFVALVGSQDAAGTCQYDSANDYDAPIAYAPSVCDLPPVAVCGYDTGNEYDNDFDFDAAVCALAPLPETPSHGMPLARRRHPYRPALNSPTYPPHQAEEAEALFLCGLL